MDFVAIALFVLLLFWLKKCLIFITEGQHKIILWFKRYDKLISGSKDRIALADGTLVNGENNTSWDLIFWPFHTVDEYPFSFSQPMDTNKIDPSDEKNVLWGNLKNDSEVTYQRTVLTDHHRDVFDYRFRFNDLETGEKHDAVAGADMVENIKIDSNLNSTVRMLNPVKARFKAGGAATWFTSLHAVLNGLLGEVICGRVYADLGELRGEKLAKIMVKDIRPGAKDDDKMTFIERVNYEMNDPAMRDLGVEIIAVSLLDFKLSEADQPYEEALRKRAISATNLTTAKNNAQALKEGLDVKAKVVKDVVETYQESTIKIKQTKDITAVEKASAQPNLRVLVESGNSSGSSIPPLDINKLIENVISFDLVNEISDASQDTKQKKQGGK